MAHVPAAKFGGKTQKVKLLIDQRVLGVGLSKGDTCDLPVADALYLKNIGRVTLLDEDAPKTATR